MLRGKSNASPPPPPDADWEVLPGGMLVQKRIPGTTSAADPPPPSIRLRVKHGLLLHEIYLSSQSTFGEVKKLLWQKTGVHPQEQRILFKNRERDSSGYLDTAGVKDGSRITVEEDLTARAKRQLEKRRVAQAERAAKSLAATTDYVDGLVSKVSELESVVGRSDQVAEKEVAELTELLMEQLVKLDTIPVNEGKARHQREMQVSRVQRNVEKLDLIKLKSSNLKPLPFTVAPNKQPQRQQVVVTTQWEVFDGGAAAPVRAAVPDAGGRIEWQLL